MTAEELVTTTGRARSTVKKYLERMLKLVDNKTGELLPMVEYNNGIWHAMNVDLEAVALAVGTAGLGAAERVIGLYSMRT